MAESDVVRVAREYREQLARNEDAALKRMSRYWTKMERSLSAEFLSLAQEVLARQARGEAIPRQFIYTMDRYRSMMEQVQREMPYYQLSVEDLIKDYQRKNFTLGIDGANEIIQASQPDSDVWTRVYKDAAETMAGFAGNGAPLHELLKTDYGDLGERVTDALVSGVGLGRGYQDIARDMRDAMGMDFDRSLRIARTEINRSYRLANAEQYARSGVVEKVLRLCFKPTACFACLELDGEECPNGVCDDHPNGKCTTVVKTTGGIVPDWEKGSDWLMQQSEEDQRRIMGEGRFDLWKNFGVDPHDMVYMKDNPVWGGSPAMFNLSDLRTKYSIPAPKNTAPTLQPAPNPAPVNSPVSYTFSDMMGNAYQGNKYTPAQMADIQHMYEGMPQYMQEFYHKFGGDLEPVAENNQGVVPRKKTDFGYFDKTEGQSGRVHFLAKRDASGRIDQYPYELGAHEYAHNMDYLAGGKNPNDYLSNQYRDAQGRTFLQIINDDLDRDVRILVGKTNGELLTSSDIDKVCDVMRNTYTMKERGVLSDIFENYSVTHGGQDFPFGTGHGASYARRTGATEREAFAEINEAILANPDALEVLHEYLPGAMAAHEDMIRKATK